MNTPQAYRFLKTHHLSAFRFNHPPVVKKDDTLKGRSPGSRVITFVPPSQDHSQWHHLHKSSPLTVTGIAKELHLVPDYSFARTFNVSNMQKHKISVNDRFKKFFCKEKSDKKTPLTKKGERRPLSYTVQRLLRGFSNHGQAW